MQCRSHHPRSEFSGGIAQTVHIMVKHSHHRARARCRTGSRTRRYIRPYYRHLTRHYPRHAAKQYTLAMRSVGKQRRSTRHRSPTVNLSQYIRKRSVTAVILYQVYRHCYHIAVKQRPHRRCRLTAQRKKRQQQRPAAQPPYISHLQRRQMHHYIAPERLITAADLHTRAAVLVVRIMYRIRGMLLHPHREPLLHKHLRTLRREGKPTLGRIIAFRKSYGKQSPSRPYGNRLLHRRCGVF